MKRLMKKYTMIAAIAISVMATPAQAQRSPQGSIFTYHGSLQEGTEPANGQYDFQFQLWNALTGGSQVGSTLTHNNVLVLNGLLTVELDFGAEVFDGNARWLRISVNGTWLDPRQPINNAPYAVQTRGMFVDDDLHVGIGTTDPGAPLAVHNDDSGEVLRLVSDRTYGYMRIMEDSTYRAVLGYGDEGGLLVNALPDSFAINGLSTAMHFAVDSDATKGITVDTDGYVGIGITSPDYRLHVTDNLGYEYSLYAENTTAGSGAAISGRHSVNGSGTGVRGDGGYIGVHGIAATGAAHWFYGVKGEAEGSNSTGNYGVYGLASDGPTNYGVYGHVEGYSSINYGVYGWAPHGTINYGVYSHGPCHVSGTLSKSAGSFKIDHPLDPANMYLSHSFVESPDMMNIYNGDVITDAAGYATVVMPAWFDALNADFRYQLTVIDEYDSDEFVFAKVTQKMFNNQFTIRTSAPFTEVSWQVTGIRIDAYAEAYRIPVEEYKPASERGLYEHPKLFGQPQEKGINYVNSPVVR